MAWQLSQLYEEGLGTIEGQREFTAYQLLYNVGQLASNVVADIMLALTQADRVNKFIGHALQVALTPPPLLSAPFRHVRRFRAPRPPTDLLRSRHRRPSLAPHTHIPHLLRTRTTALSPSQRSTSGACRASPRQLLRLLPLV